MIGTVTSCVLLFIIGFSIGEHVFFAKKPIKKREKLIISKAEKKVKLKPKILKVLPKAKKEEKEEKPESKIVKALPKAREEKGGEKFEIQVFSTIDKKKAKDFKNMLIQDGYKAKITKTIIEDKTFYRIILIGTNLNGLKHKIDNLFKRGFIQSYLILKPYKERVILTPKEKQEEKPEEEEVIQVFATSLPDKAEFIRKKLKEKGYNIQIKKINDIYRIYLAGEESIIRNQAKEITDKRIIEELFIKKEKKKEVVLPKPEEKKLRFNYVIQVASLTSQEKAENLVNTLRRKGKYPAYIKVVQRDNIIEYKVRLSGFEDKESALTFAKKLKEEGIIEEFLITKE
jgi:cell division septation protein DedD